MFAAEPIIYIDNSEIIPGRHEELTGAIKELADFVQANEPELIAYRVYFSADGMHMSVMHIHPNSASLEHHFKVTASRFARFAGLIHLSRIDVYGELNHALVERLREKARMLGPGVVVVHPFQTGFSRLIGYRSAA